MGARSCLCGRLARVDAGARAIRPYPHLHRDSIVARMSYCHRCLGLFAFTVGSLASAAAVRAQPLPTARVTGEVFDSLAMRPLPGATVQLVTTEQPARIRSATADSRGLFRFDSVTVGVYLIGFLHPLLDSLGIDGSMARVEIASPDPIAVALSTPSPAMLIAARCGPTQPGRPQGLFVGRVRVAGGAPLTTAARVRAQYTQTVASERGLERRTPSQFGTTDGDGLFSVCGVPAGRVINVRAFTVTDSSGFVELTVPNDGLMRRDLLVGPAIRTRSDTASRGEALSGTARFRGTVRNAAGNPVAGARVVVLGTAREATSGNSGQVTLATLPEGSYTLETRALGYQPLRTVVDLDGSAPTEAELTLATLPPAVDTMRVRADRMAVPLAEFERRRKLGFGHFLDEAQITARAPNNVADVFRQTPGVVTMPGQFGRDRVLLRGTGMTGDCPPAVFLNGLLIPNEDGDLDAIVNARDVRAVEVYARTASVPLQFQTRNGCGSVVIWTGARSAPARQ